MTIKIGNDNAADVLARRISEEFPDFESEFVWAHRMRFFSVKGCYDIRLMGESSEIRTAFRNKGENPLKHGDLIHRSAGKATPESVEGHIRAIRENELQLPWVRKTSDPANGVETVTILPFGADEDAPRVVVRTRTDTGLMSLDIEGARNMSPAEARLVAKALSRAAKLAARRFVIPVLEEEEARVAAAA